MTIRPIAESDREAFERAYANTERPSDANWIWMALCGDDGAPVVFVPVRPALEVGTVARDPKAVGNPMRMLAEFTADTAGRAPVFKRSTGTDCERRLRFLGGDVGLTAFRYDGA